MQPLVLSQPALTDSYKDSQWYQHPPDTANLSSYFEARSGKHRETTFFGLQYQLKQYFARPVTLADVEEEFEDAKLHYNRADVFNRAGWQHVVDKHGGYMPVRISAVQEGLTIPISNVLMDVEATCPQCYWTVDHVETLLVENWYPISVCSLSRRVKQILLRYLDRTGTPARLPFLLHDFGFRGASSVETAMIGGAAHLVNFMGTDTKPALKMLRRFYGERMAGFSIPAMQHSTISSWGKDHEADSYRNMLAHNPEGIIAAVGDTYDIGAAIDHIWGELLRNEVLGRKGVVAVRNDSGSPPKMAVRCVEGLRARFGGESNGKGYFTLNPKVSVVMSDGNNENVIEEVCHALQVAELSLDNIGAFGMGSALLQEVRRDDHGFAYKCSARQNTKGEWLDVYKSPKDDTSKRSKRGRLALIMDEAGRISTVPQYTGLASDGARATNLLELVYQEGALARDMHFKQVRANAELPQPVSV